MTKKRTTKRALMMSALSLLMCVSMLIGSTYAWFTDSVTSAGNIIKSGNLDVVMEWKDAANGAQQTYVDASAGPIFNYELWEPGYVEAKNVKIHNNGSLALKYKLFIDPETDLTEDGVKLADVIDVYFAEGEHKLADREMTELEKIGTLSEVLAGMPANMSGDLLAGETDKVTIALKMQESAGNEYQNKSIGAQFSVILVATQMEAEFDSFDKDYDKDATYPMGKSDEAIGFIENPKIEAVVSIPAEAPEYDYDLKFTDVKYTNENSQATLNFDMKLVDENGTEVPKTNLEYKVNIQLPHHFVNMDNLQVTHNQQPVEDLSYDKEDRIISFTTTGFSPFEIKYTDYVDSSFELDYKVVDWANDKYTIKKGMFIGKNPADYDETLKGADSEYIAVDFTKDGAKNYVVSERATTIIVGDADDGGSAYTFENGNIPAVKMINDNTLNKSTVGKLNGYDHGTVLILPGTYNEQTRLEPTTHMDIVGLGNAEDIKLIKMTTTSKSSSHQHLFNCNGNSAREEHIRVTLRNLYLDSTVGNGPYKTIDNGAVQAIRKAKVKCYDLVIKDNGFAFYVNATNAAGDGKLYSAYMYVENTVISGNSVLSHSGNKTEGANAAYFSHYGLSYANGSKAYSINQTLTRDGICYVSNTAMAADDWDW